MLPSVSPYRFSVLLKAHLCKLIQCDLFAKNLSCRKFEGTQSYSRNLLAVVGFTKMLADLYYRTFPASKMKGISFPVLRKIQRLLKPFAIDIH